jgi:hypothetical protein
MVYCTYNSLFEIRTILTEAFQGAALGPGGVIYGAITTLLVGQYIRVQVFTVMLIPIYLYSRCRWCRFIRYCPGIGEDLEQTRVERETCIVGTISSTVQDHRCIQAFDFRVPMATIQRQAVCENF